MNRITFSLAVIFCLALAWEFWVRPNSSPLYTEAVAQFHDGNYNRSLQLLRAAYRIDPNDTAILSLMGWDCLKLNDAPRAEPYFERAHTLAPQVADSLLGYAYTELVLKKNDEAAALLMALGAQNLNTVDTHLAWATLYLDRGQNRDAAIEFQQALALDEHNPVAIKNLDEILDTTGDVQRMSTDFPPLARPQKLTYTARVTGDHFDWRSNGGWQPTYLVGVDFTPVLPGHFPSDSVTDSTIYNDWLEKISDLGTNTLRVYTILPAAFYRMLAQLNHNSGKPVRLLQGISFSAPPGNDLFNRRYDANCQKAIRDTIDAIHGQADLGKTETYSGGVFTNDVSPWVAGFLLDQSWPSHVVIANNQLHSSMQHYRGTYVEASSASATEIFLAQMIDYTAEYEETKYNWQRPIAFVNSPALDPMHHPTESTMFEEVALRRAKGERFSMPAEPYDDDDAVTLDPMHLHALRRFLAGYFAAYSVFPFYPDFISRDPAYRQARDEEGSNPFFGYVRDLKAHHRGVPLIISEYGIPTSVGIGHFGGAGFDQGGDNEGQQGRALSRMTRAVFDAGAAGGMVFEWVDEWYRQTWIVRNFEKPRDRKPLWTSAMDPAEDFGLLAAEPHLSRVHALEGTRPEWDGTPPLYVNSKSHSILEAGDQFDPARRLKALYADADEGFLYLRLAVDQLDNDHDGEPDWNQANYLIGISTTPGHGGLTSLPFIAPIKFPMGMTYAIQLAGKDSSRIWIASSYNPYRLVTLTGQPARSVLLPKLGWHVMISDAGSFEPQIIEPNRRRFSRNGEYFPPRRYDRGILRYGSLDPQSTDYDSLAEWHANVHTNAIDLRIPWSLLNVTDPSSFRVLAGINREGTVETVETPGFLIAVFSYRPSDSARAQPIMEEDQPIADAMPALPGPIAVLGAGFKYYRWKGWSTPQYFLKPKDSYALLRKAFLALHARQEPNRNISPQIAAIGQHVQSANSIGPGSHGRQPEHSSDGLGRAGHER
ncbi:MAG TPA: tetratricopeptide repeat protein [Terriglobia bacterium]|nr:tetratricopeptide repeat protein [Terriglobia bacterium]